MCNYNLEAICYLKWIYLYFNIKLQSAKVLLLLPIWNIFLVLSNCLSFQYCNRKNGSIATFKLWLLILFDYLFIYCLIALSIVMFYSDYCSFLLFTLLFFTFCFCNLKVKNSKGCRERNKRKVARHILNNKKLIN